MRRFVFGALLAVLLSGLLPFGQAQAQGGERCFRETGYCISGQIRTYWENNGGLPVFGYPISAQSQQTVEGRSLQVQWFERDRLEIQNNGIVTAGRLGARLLELHWRPWQTGPGYPDSPDCRYFPQVGYNMCGAFRAYWEQNGGLERFGFPISPPVDEVIENRSYKVQYFERRRMELHPELPGSPVLLGLLGAQVQGLLGNTNNPDYPRCLGNTTDVMRRALAQMAATEVLGCPVLYAPTDMPASIQRMEHGEMIWFAPQQTGVPGGVLTPMVFAIGKPPQARNQGFIGASDSWQEGVDPDTAPFAAPAGRYAPWRGFGKLWANDPRVRELVGWALEPQSQGRRADYQIFEGGLLVRIYEPGQAGAVYAFGGYSIPSQVQKVQP